MRVLVVAVVALMSCVIVAPASAAARYSGRAVSYGGGGGDGLGPTHEGSVGDGGIRSQFLDRNASGTSFRVCWTRPQGVSPTNCRTAKTQDAGRYRTVYLADPGGVGAYEIRWYVGGRLAAAWKMTWHVGD